MNTSAYLSSQGWLGTGHSLHPSGRGIKKPLLVSQKKNVLGIGKKKHDIHADQWWARAFDSSLRGLEVGKNETTEDLGSVTTARTWGALDLINAGGAKWALTGGLYAGFVKGASLVGTISPENREPEDSTQEREGFAAVDSKEGQSRSKAGKRKKDSGESISRHKRQKIKKKKNRRESSDVAAILSDPPVRNDGQPSIFKAGLDTVELHQEQKGSSLASAFQKQSQDHETSGEPSLQLSPERKRRKHNRAHKP